MSERVVQEPDRVPSWRLWVAIGAISAVSAAAGVFCIRTLPPRAEAGRAAEKAHPAHVLEGDALDEAPGLRLAAEDRRRLESYGWVDREAGVVRVPVDRAIDVLVEREAAR